MCVHCLFSLWLLHWVVIKTYHIRKGNTNSTHVWWWWWWCVCVCMCAYSICVFLYLLALFRGHHQCLCLATEGIFALWCFGPNQINWNLFHKWPNVFFCPCWMCRVGDVTLRSWLHFCCQKHFISVAMQSKGRNALVMVPHSNRLYLVNDDPQGFLVIYTKANMSIEHPVDSIFFLHGLLGS